MLLIFFIGNQVKDFTWVNEDYSFSSIHCVGSLLSETRDQFSDLFHCWCWSPCCFFLVHLGFLVMCLLCLSTTSLIVSTCIMVSPVWVVCPVLNIYPLWPLPARASLGHQLCVHIILSVSLSEYLFALHVSPSVLFAPVVVSCFVSPFSCLDFVLLWIFATVR